MASLAAKRIVGALALVSLATAYAGCGGTSSAPRETAAGMPGVGGSGATGGSGPKGGSGGSGMATGSGGVPISMDPCSGVGTNALIVDFDEGATIAINNYPIAGGAMPGGTYAYIDPMDATMMTATAVIDGGHKCKALSFILTGASWRGAGLWSTKSVTSSAYTGVTFWAKRGASSTDPTMLTVSLGLDAVTKTGTGSGTCASTSDSDCVRPQAKVNLTDTWTEFPLYWSAFTPGSALGVVVPASGEGVNGLDLAFSTSSTTTTTTEVDLDDVAFLTSAPPASGGSGGKGGMASAGATGMGGLPGAAGSSSGTGGMAAGSGGMAASAGAGGAVAGSGGAAAGGTGGAGAPAAGTGDAAAGASGASGVAGAGGTAGAGGAAAGAPMGGMAGT